MNLHQYAETHEVTNQVPSLDGANLYRLDLPLQEWVRRYQGGWAEERLQRYGEAGRRPADGGRLPGQPAQAGVP